MFAEITNDIQFYWSKNGLFFAYC